VGAHYVIIIINVAQCRTIVNESCRCQRESATHTEANHADRTVPTCIKFLRSGADILDCTSPVEAGHEMAGFLCVHSDLSTVKIRHQDAVLIASTHRTEVSRFMNTEHALEHWHASTRVGQTPPGSYHDMNRVGRRLTPSSAIFWA
jgi:hypothetical protein